MNFPCAGGLVIAFIRNCVSGARFCLLKNVIAV